MQRKKIVKVPVPDHLSIADALLIMNQTIVVSMVMQRGVDPNEAYELWEENKGQILACTEIVSAILYQYGDELDLLHLTLPDGVGMGGYKVEDIDLLGKRDGLPF